jgi:hypothetical protein
VDDVASGDAATPGSPGGFSPEPLRPMTGEMDEQRTGEGATPAPLEPLEAAAPVEPSVVASGGRGLVDLGPIALAAGVVGLLAGPLLIGDPTARYVVLVADVLALALGALALWAAVRRFARLDLAVAAMVCGGASLFLFVSYVTDPPQGGT